MCGVGTPKNPETTILFNQTDVLNTYSKVDDIAVVVSEFSCEGSVKIAKPYRKCCWTEAQLKAVVGYRRSLFVNKSETGLKFWCWKRR